MQRWVGFIRIEGLYARLERERGAPAPLAVADGKLLRDACPMARMAGARPGVPVATARRLCAGLHVLPYEARRYRADANRWMRLGLEHAPWLEPLNPHEAFLDLSGHPDPNAAIAAVHRAVSDLGHTARAAVATNKLVARAATMVPDTLDDPVTLVPPGAESAFLAMWPVRILWPLDEKLLGRLERLEYENVAEVAAADVSDLKAQVGKQAALVHAFARGRYHDPVRALFPEETIRRRARWLEGLERTDDILLAVEALAESAARDLGGRCCRVLSLTLEREDLSRLEARETRKMLDRTGLLRAARRLAEGLAESLALPTPDDPADALAAPAPVVGVALVAAALADPPPLEGDLFTLDKIRRARALSEAVACLEERYGKRILFHACEAPVPWRERAWQAFWERHKGSFEVRVLSFEETRPKRRSSSLRPQNSKLKTRTL